MADKQFYVGVSASVNEFGESGNFVGSQQQHRQPDQQQLYTPFAVHCNNGNNSSANTFSPLESNSAAAQLGEMGSMSSRCFTNPSASQINMDASPIKQFYASNTGVSSYNTANPQASYANVTAKPTKYDPFRYQQQSRSPQNNFQLRQNQNQTTRQFFDEHHHLQQQQQQQHHRPGLGGGPISPTGFPQPPTSRSHQQHQPSLPPFLPPFHHQFQSGNRHPPPAPPFFPLGPSTVGGPSMSSTAMAMNSLGNNMGEMPPALHPTFMFDGQTGTPNGQMATINGTGSTVDFNEDFFGGAMPAQYVLSDELLEKIQNSGKRKTLFELQIGLEQIAYDVSNIFDTWATVIRDRMVGIDPLPVTDMNIAMAILIEMATVLDDSQYNYSRLGQFLCRTIDNFAVNTLLPQVSSFISETNNFLSVQHMRNLVLFLAELYDKLEIKGVKSSELAAYLFDQLRNLLKLQPISDQTVNVMVKVLKLVGRFIENDRGPQAVGEFLSDLDQVVQQGSAQLSESVKGKVRSLVELRDNNWGVVAEPTSVTGATTTSTTTLTIIEPTGGVSATDGEQLTEDECAFMEENLDTYGNSPCGAMFTTAFDEDNVEDDYERFLQATAIRAAEKALEKASIDEDDDESSTVSSPKFPVRK